MSSTIKNIIILIVVAVALVLVYIFFIKKAPVQDATLTSSTTGAAVVPGAGTTSGASDTAAISEDFITLLLNVKSIKLDDTIFSDQAFISLRDSSITLTQTGDEGRPNPFAPIGSEAMGLPVDLGTGGDTTLPVIPSTIPPTTSPITPPASSPPVIPPMTPPPVIPSR